MAPGPDYSLRPVAWSEMAGWDEDDPSPVLAAILRCRHYLEAGGKPYKPGHVGVTADDLLSAYRLLPASAESAGAARQAIEMAFSPFLVQPERTERGFVTAFYEPEVEVRSVADADYRFPFYCRPDDLVDLDAANRPQTIEASIAFGRREADGTIGLYPDRRAIDEGYLAGRNLEIAYARSKVDVFFAHVQGAARLLFPDGRMTRITYAAKAGHAFSPIGRHLIDLGEIDPVTISMQSIRAWLAAHPERVDEILWHNRSYIFFREAEVEDKSLGPIAAAKVALQPDRSLAVDRTIHTFGTPFFIVSESLTQLDAGKPFARTMLALDTGSAIVGPARGDIFTGSGDEAGERAGAVRNAADFYVLLPKATAARLGHG
ncbi:membrane-bound lytic murein transglycosylase A [Rhizobium sp. RU20A]|uniref:murein transglycosylase A n=1 Tax=Rhizobium sp. RU20A TaxID=1907412 RepID=UPI0009546492|nr:murein transglycosylase A [Rhizobium sp. RU20A]SIQ84303.1 membrane-bound lytic murein transglycosylase A [Rhizobium sp. RU20A]